MSSAAGDHLILGPPVAGLPVGNASSSAEAGSTSTAGHVAGAEVVEHLQSGAFGNPCLNFFALVDRDTPPQHLRDLLAAAWEHDALTALKLVFNLRGVRDNGKGDREGFYTAALWMHQYHPRTLAGNLSAFAEFGYIKDFPELLYRIIHGADARKVAKAKSKAWGGDLARLSGRKRARDDDDDPTPAASTDAVQVQPQPQPQPDHLLADAVNLETEDVVGEAPVKGSPSKKVLKAARLAKLAMKIYHEDDNYRLLFNSITSFFVDNLRSDLEHHKSGKLSKIGLTAKWCPSPDSSFDQSTLLCEAIARGLFPRESDASYANMKEEHYIFLVRRRLRREVLVPLRKDLELPEIYMSKNQWSDLPYERVASEAMRIYEHLFKKHDEGRFTAFLKDHKDSREAAKHKAKKAAPQPPLLQDIITSLGLASHASNIKRREDAAQQWRTLVDHLRGKGSLCNCMAVCDVNRGGLVKSEGQKLLKICVGLGFLISELSSPPWTNSVHAFASNYFPLVLPVGSYREKLNFIRQMPCEERFNLKKVFEGIITRAVTSGVTPDNMVKTIFIFTDKFFEKASVRPVELIEHEDFNPLSSRPWHEEYRRVCEEFKRVGFQDVVPQIVLWNLKGPRSAGLTATKDGVMTLSGYSDELMRLFLENNGVVEPEDEMLDAIAGDEYQKLQVID